MWLRPMSQYGIIMDFNTSHKYAPYPGSAIIVDSHVKDLFLGFTRQLTRRVDDGDHVTCSQIPKLVVEKRRGQSFIFGIWHIAL